VCLGFNHSTYAPRLRQDLSSESDDFLYEFAGMREALRRIPLVVWVLLGLSLAFLIFSGAVSYKISDYQHYRQATGACKQSKAKPLPGTREQGGKAEAKEEPGEETQDGYLARCWSAKSSDEAIELAVRQLRLAAFNIILGGVSATLAAWAIIAALIAAGDTAAARGRVVPESPSPAGAGAGTRITFRNLGPGAVYLRGFRSLALSHAPSPSQIRREVRQTADPLSVVLAARKKEVVLLPAEASLGQVLLVIAHYSDDGGDRHAWRLFRRDQQSGIYTSIDYSDG
jgi:hypothetical protein